MDKKYIIDLDSKGLINYVGINTPEGLVINILLAQYTTKKKIEK